MARKKLDTENKLFDSENAVLAMPDGYYSGDRVNPNLRKFVTEHATPYDPEADDYNVRAFTTPITTTKATAIYNMHSYHQGKKPHDAIRQYIRHYTSVGNIVLDTFAGSGSTALAALMERRIAIAIDRSPAATFITKNYCTPINISDLQQTFDKLRHKVQPEVDWLYETRCDRCAGKAKTIYTLYSQVFQCPRCLSEVPLFDCDKSKGATAAGKPKTLNICPFCKKKGHIEEISTRTERLGAIPVLVGYECLTNCSPARDERGRNDTNPEKRRYFEKFDLGKLLEIDKKDIPYSYPTNKMMNVEDDTISWGDKWRAGTSNFRTVAELYSKRNLWAIAAYFSAAHDADDAAQGDAFRFGLSSILLAMSKMQGYVEDPRFPNQLLRGTYYLPQVSREYNVGVWLAGKLTNLLAGYKAIDGEQHTNKLIISTQSATTLDAIPSNSVDYIFTDPPYSDNVQYGELNFIWETWLGFDTHWHDQEIVVNHVRGVSEVDWALMMKQAVGECYRVLKPGRWLSLCYHDTSEGTWELVQDIMAEVGFVVDKTESALFIDAGQKSYNQLTADKSTKRDLVLNFRKPKPDDWRVTEMFIPANVDVATFHELARQVIADFLTTQPGATKDRIYDTLISSMVRKGQMETHDFDALLRSVAEEVQQPVKEDLFRNKEPDLFGSHVQSRWYLKETADQVDHAEQAKEDAAAAHLSKFIGGYLKKKPEFEGVHYSDLFEHYLPVQDKPRRLLADWLVEYFIKTASGTWRLPDEEEAQQLAKLREAGTLRRIKRFANVLIEGVPVRDKDRPGSDVDLLDWLRQCRRAGLYEQGKAIYEKGGLNSASLNDEQQIEAEDDYRICARRGSDEEAKPKRQRRKNQNDDDE